MPLTFMSLLVAAVGVGGAATTSPTIDDPEAPPRNLGPGAWISNDDRARLEAKARLEKIPSPAPLPPDDDEDADA